VAPWGGGGISKKPMGSGPGEGVNGVWGQADLCCCGYCLPPTLHSELCTGQHHTKISSATVRTVRTWI
jgi:hypothetical protein